MNIQKARKIREQVELAKGLKAELIRLVRRKWRSESPGSEKALHWHELLRELELTAESFDLASKYCAAKDVDRRTSMLTGPFFTSEEFPVPSAATGPMFPVVQIRLQEAAAAAQEKIGDGLLQLWLDLGTKKELIRVIPLTKVYRQPMTEFQWRQSGSDDSFPLPSGWNLDPVGDQVAVISRLKSAGFQSHTASIEACYWQAAGGEPSWLWTLLKLCLQNTPYKSGRKFSLLGVFYPIQYSAAEVDRKCLINIADWGASGNAQIFYKTSNGQPTQFSFWSCLR